MNDVKLLKETLKILRKNIKMYHAVWYHEPLTLAKEVDVGQRIKRNCRTQWYRHSFDEDIGVEYYKKFVLIPFLDHFNT